MAQPLSGTVTVEDLYRLPLDGRRYELVEGNLLSEPLPGARHGRVAARVARVLGAFVESGNLGDVLPGFSVPVSELF
jgi:Uma2 family endonuclease